MTREWKPGDVALVNGDVCIYMEGSAGAMVWEHGRRDRFAYPTGTNDPRPLVVIDPEDREQVERLRDRLMACDRHGGKPCYSTTCHADRLADALREFVDPMLVEPTGLGAVVEDADGADWHRTREGRWIHADGLHTRTGGWRHIDAVRVLSEGVES